MEPDDEVIELLTSRKSWLEPSILVREYTARLNAIPAVKVRIRIWLDPWMQREPYRFELSHYAATPDQAGAYLPSAPWSATEAGALRAGMKAIETWVAGAVRQGHRPDESWLQPSSTWE